MINLYSFRNDSGYVISKRQLIYHFKLKVICHIERTVIYHLEETVICHIEKRVLGAIFNWEQRLVLGFI